MDAGPHNRLLDPSVLARLGNLDLVSRTVVDGLLTGLHRSPHFGFSQEFAEYRAYNEGDDLRFVDWNVYARTERAYIKRYRGETNASITILLDASASMGFGEPVSKLDQARYLAASIAYLVRRQHDALGLVTFDDAIRDFIPPSSKPDSLRRAFGVLERTEARSGTRWLEAIEAVRAATRKRGLIIMISDCYAEADEVVASLQPLSHGGQDLAVFHVLDTRELEPDVRTISSLKDMETGDATVVDPDWLANGYREAMAEHTDRLADACRQVRADYIRLLTHEPLDEALHRYLQFREKRS